MADRSFVAVLLTMLAGALIWAIHFTIIYGFTSVACAHGLADTAVLGMDLVRLTVVVATGVAALAVLAIVVRCLRYPDRRSPQEDRATTWQFVRWLTAAVAGLALVFIVMEGMTAALVPPCV
jgi:hypothetical protein